MINIKYINKCWEWYLSFRRFSHYIANALIIHMPATALGVILEEIVQLTIIELLSKCQPIAIFAASSATAAEMNRIVLWQAFLLSPLPLHPFLSPCSSTPAVSPLPWVTVSFILIQGVLKISCVFQLCREKVLIPTNTGMGCNWLCKLFYKPS